MGCCNGNKTLFYGVAILVVAIAWPRYIWHTIGVIVILKGLFAMQCGTCSAPMPKKAPAKKAKRKK